MKCLISKRMNIKFTNHWWRVKDFNHLRVFFCISIFLDDILQLTLIDISAHDNLIISISSSCSISTYFRLSDSPLWMIATRILSCTSSVSITKLCFLLSGFLYCDFMSRRNRTSVFVLELLRTVTCNLSWYGLRSILLFLWVICCKFITI